MPVSIGQRSPAPTSLETGRKSRATQSADGNRVPFNPTIKTLYSIASAFGISIGELLEVE